MNNQHSLDNIDSLLFQLALETRKLSQKKNELDQQIKVCRADIAEKRSYFGALHRNIKKLEEEIIVKQSTVTRNKGNSKRTKTTNGLLLQYEQTLKAELETRKTSYNHDLQVFEERIASYRKTFQEHKGYYLQNPLAEKLLLLQAEKEEIECRIKAWDEQISMKQKKLDHLTDPVVTSFSTEKLPDSAFGLQPVTEQEKVCDQQTAEDSDPSIDISSLHLSQSKKGHKKSDEEENEEIHDGNIQDSSMCCSSPEKGKQSEPEEIHTEEQEEETPQEDQEKLLVASYAEEVLQCEMEKGVATHEEQVLSDKDNEELAGSHQMSSQEPHPQAFPANMTAVYSTPAFSFNFGAATSQDQGPPETKSPAFPFSLNSDSNTPGFPGFGFDEGASQEEDSFGFAGSLFTDEKKTTESKSPGCPQFLFDQPEQSDDFQFAFATQSPQSAKKGSAGDDFPFSFNF